MKTLKKKLNKNNSISMYKLKFGSRQWHEKWFCVNLHSFLHLRVLNEGGFLQSPHQLSYGAGILRANNATACFLALGGWAHRSSFFSHIPRQTENRECGALILTVEDIDALKGLIDSVDHLLRAACSIVDLDMVDRTNWMVSIEDSTQFVGNGLRVLHFSFGDHQF